MKVLFATNHSYPPKRVGGSESSTHDLCLTLGELGHEVAVLSSSVQGQPIGARVRVRSSRGRGGGVVRDEALGYPVFRAVRPASAVRELVRGLTPNVAVIQAGRPLVLTERFTELGVPCVVYLRDAVFGRLGGTVRDRPNLRYVATSGDLGRRFAEAFGIVPLSIPPLVRPERYRVEPVRKNVTFVCPLPSKGVEIAAGLAARRPDIPFVFLESWWLSPVRQLIVNRRIRSAANITLRPPTHDMRGVYRDTRLLVVPSRRPEAWGRVASEAQVSGIPVLASDHGGLPESVGKGGILVDPAAGLDRWERELARIWDDQAEYERLAELAIQHSRRPEFQPAAIAAELVTVLADLIRAAEPVPSRQTDG
jgi:glycosyltransferase involved in cell wall biosynthesis